MQASQAKVRTLRIPCQQESLSEHQFGRRQHRSSISNKVSDSLIATPTGSHSTMKYNEIQFDVQKF